MNLDANSHCRFCGASLTFVEAVLERHRGPGPPGWLENVRAQAGGIKATEAEASQRRMAALLEIDRKRKLAEAEAAARQREKDRRTMIILFSAAGLLLVLIAAIALAMSLRG
jgi:predicted nucleic acid-binding Zn ribbon protein